MKFLLTAFIFLSFTTFSQEEPYSSMYWNNYSYFNPAMTGLKYTHEANASYRVDWIKNDPSPNVWFINFGMRLGENHGIGVNYIRTFNGYFSTTSKMKVNYNYQFELKGNRKLAIGAAVSYLKSVDQYFWSSFNQNVVNADFGLAYTGEKITAGISTTQLRLYADSKYVSADAIYFSEFQPFQDQPYLFGNLRYDADAFGASKALIFETKIRTDFEKYYQDFNVGYNFKNILELGVGYRTSNEVLINLTGTINEKYRVGYSFSHGVNKLNTNSRGGHEFALGLRIPN